MLHSTLFRRLLFTGLLLAASACGANSGNIRTTPNRPTIDVTIENRNSLDAKVYLLCSGFSGRRIALVVAHLNRTVRNVPFCGQAVQFGIDLIGSREGYRTFEVDPIAGDHVVLTIGHYLRYTNVYLIPQ